MYNTSLIHRRTCDFLPLWVSAWVASTDQHHPQGSLTAVKLGQVGLQVPLHTCLARFVQVWRQQWHQWLKQQIHVNKLAQNLIPALWATPFTRCSAMDHSQWARSRDKTTGLGCTKMKKACGDCYLVYIPKIHLSLKTKNDTCFCVQQQKTSGIKKKGKSLLPVFLGPQIDSWIPTP